MMFSGFDFAEAGVDLHVVVGRVGDEDALLLERRLADQRLADVELLVEVLALLVRVGRGELEASARTPFESIM